VTPEELKQMGVKNPERFLQNRQKLEQNLQQRVQKRVQRQEMRRILEEAQKNPKVLEDLRKLFEEPKAKTDPAHSRRMLGRSQGAARDVAAPTSSEIAPTSIKDIHTQDASGPCLQWNLDTSRVTGTEIPVSDGTALQVVYSLHVQNICSDSVDNILYGAIENWQCSEGCVSSSGSSSNAFRGIPSSIGQNQFSAGIWDNQVWCVQSDNNGEPVYVPPASVTIIASVQGQQKGSRIYSPQVTFER
jgi:hypothetical protein